MPALVLAEHDNASIKAPTLNTVTAAGKAGGEVHVLVVGSGCAAAAQQAAKIGGVTKVLVADAPHFANQLAENVAAQVVAVAQGYSHVFAAATATGKNVMPRAAALLDSAQVSDIISVESADTFTRPIYAGNAIATVQCTDAIKVVTARPTNFDPAPAEGGSAAVENVTATADAGLSQFNSRDIAKSDRPELQGAKVVVSGGRGMGSAENFKLLEPLADKLGAAMGASRAAVDAGAKAVAARRQRLGRHHIVTGESNAVPSGPVTGATVPCRVIEQPTADASGARGFVIAARGNTAGQRRTTHNANGQLLLYERRSHVYASARDVNFMVGDLQTLTVEYPGATPAVTPADHPFLTLRPGRTGVGRHRRRRQPDHTQLHPARLAQAAQPSAGGGQSASHPLRVRRGPPCIHDLPP
jgi:electron transfer flavoprotein alpha subunit